MSDSFDFELDSVVAAGLGANKGFWMIQPRDDGGQWIEMGADVLFRFRSGQGNLVVGTARGVYVGPGSRPGAARIMVQEPGETGLQSGVYEVDSRNLQQFQALLPETDEAGAPKTRTDKFGRPVKTLADSKLPDLQSLLSGRREITPEDERLGRGELTPEEESAKEQGRNESPIAEMPAGFEAENPAEVKKLLRDVGVEPDRFLQSEDEDSRPTIAKQLNEMGAKQTTTPEDTKNRTRRFELDTPDGKLEIVRDGKNNWTTQGEGDAEPVRYSSSQELIDDVNSKYPPADRFTDGPFIPGRPPSSFTEEDTRKIQTQSPSDRDFKGRTPKDIINGKKPPKDYLDDLGAEGVRDGRNVELQRDNERKRKDRDLLEKELGRPLTNDEISALNLNEIPQQGFGESGIPEVYYLSEDPEVQKQADLKRAQALAKMQADLDGNPISDKEALQEGLARELFTDAIASNRAPDLDTAIETFNKTAENEASRPKTKSTKALNLNKGMKFVAADGNTYTIESIDLESGRMTLRGPDGRILAEEVPDPKNPERMTLAPKRFPFETNGTFDVVTDDQPSKPAKPARPRQPEPATPEAEAPEAPEAPEDAPEAPEAPETPELVVQDGDSNDPSDLPSGFPPADKVDDGTSPIEHAPLSEEGRKKAIKKKIAAFVNKITGMVHEYFDEKGNKKPAQDPFELLNALAEAYPNAKFSPDGTALILDRRTDSDGRLFELRASNSGSKALVYTMRWTDPGTGKYEELVHIDKRHSVTAVFRKDNGPDGLMERLLNGEPLPHGNARPIPGDASLRERASWFEKKQKMFTPANLATFYGNGRKAIFHKGTAILKNREVLPIWDAYLAFKANPNAETADQVYHRLMGVFGRIPMDTLAHMQARSALRMEFKRLYPGENMRSMGALITNASRLSRGLSYDASPEVRAVPYASKDRTRPIEPGMTVEYTNNVEEKSVLKVVGFAGNVGVVRGQDGDQYDYEDYVYAKDASGKTVRLNSIFLRILKDQDAPTSDYKKNLEGAELQERRISLGLYGLSGDSMPDPTPGSSSIARDAPPPLPDIIDDLIEGDMLPDLKSGGTVGEIVRTRFVRTKSGDEAMEFVVVTEEGEQKAVVYRLGREIPKKD